MSSKITVPVGKQDDVSGVRRVENNEQTGISHQKVGDTNLQEKRSEIELQETTWLSALGSLDHKKKRNSVSWPLGIMRILKVFILGDDMQQSRVAAHRDVRRDDAPIFDQHLLRRKRESRLLSGGKAGVNSEGNSEPEELKRDVNAGRRVIMDPKKRTWVIDSDYVRRGRSRQRRFNCVEVG